ncbi:PREDICTED: 39S ribosomal protein L35, mitochondrial isoform X1 [Rhagoletis zephyria]|uniref:39S ribosomal protein L35, mitochondrial isoform X1 n=1 Tax=Rhagoletis zephyria TaxID=28612 RepID=UPI00081181D9|nr:PREDICTED: 39S ribosomal protein L35, mitochondrial isoform X1 [Rhagoletis zephyria]
MKSQGKSLTKSAKQCINVKIIWEFGVILAQVMESSAVRTASMLTNTSSVFATTRRAVTYQTCNPLTLFNLPLLNKISASIGQRLQPSIVPSFAALQQQQSRSLTKFSLNKGKRKSVKAVIKRFKRLDWGIWIRTHTGRHKKMFKKSKELRRRLRQHVFTNATQSYMLDKMVTSFWRRPKHYIDDPYAPYHKRDEFFATKSKTFKV